MPLFTNKFSPKKTPLRKASISLSNKDLSPKRIERELGPEIGPIRLRLCDQEVIFDGGLWIPETGKAGGTFKENEKLKREIRRLEEENNLLKLKLELLIDMSTVTAAEAQLHRKKIEKQNHKILRNKRVIT